MIQDLSTTEIKPQTVISHRNEKSLFKPLKYSSHHCRPEAFLNPENLSYHLKKGTQAGSIRFNRKHEEYENLGEFNNVTSKGLARILKLSKKPRKFEIFCKV